MMTYFCKQCIKVKSEGEVIDVPKDELGNDAFVGCRDCNHKVEER